MPKQLIQVIILIPVILQLFISCVVPPSLPKSIPQSDLLLITPELQQISTQDSLYLRTIAEDTWNFFSIFVDSGSGLIPDNVGANGLESSDYTSVTNIGLYMVCVAAAEDLGFISHEKAVDYLNLTLSSLQKMERFKGFHLNWYSIPAMEITRQYISSVDAAWLYASVAAISVKYPELNNSCQNILSGVDFAWLFDPVPGQFYLGYDLEKQEFSPYHYGMLCSESRIVSYLGLAWKQVPESHWTQLYRVLPDSVDQHGSAHHFTQQIDQQKSFNSGYYLFEDSLEILPSWGGSMFEYLMPTLFVDEHCEAPMGLGENDERIIAIHRDYTLNRLGYQVWGMSPCATPDGGYDVFGVSDIGSNKEGSREDIVTPHASILALSFAPRWILDNLEMLEKSFLIRGDYGFFDSVNPKTGEVAQKYLALDQAMILLSINNYLNSGSLSETFEQVGEMDRVLELIAQEQFFPLSVDSSIIK
ncbi:MAG: DUF3131 domain-containing protein [Candidatus Marinimicrobia bacterium]|nr:DUF3131 domain-containing protein [Candidatus Neomarinimicrobiota bacterium]